MTFFWLLAVMLYEHTEAISYPAKRTSAVCTSEESKASTRLQILHEASNLLKPCLKKALPASSSCSAVLAEILPSCAVLPPSSPSGYYWVRASNDSAMRVYCDMTRSCGGVTGGWMRVFELDMANSSQQCPSGLRQRSDGNLQTCRHNSDEAGCSQVILPTSRMQYSRVCGIIKAYQVGTTDAFGVSVPGRAPNLGIEDNYVDGVSLTYGNPRQHIWTFAAGHDESGNRPHSNCPCLKDGEVVSPLVVANDYFCDTGSSSTPQLRIFYSSDPLWDGAGCGRLNTCCSFNTPPWFYKQLPQPTTDDIEMRVCRDESQSNEESPIVPTRFRYVSLNALSSNGSSTNISCSDVTFNSNGTSTCNTPSSSVLFDGHIPTLTGLDGDTWANELMILYIPPYSISSGGSLFNIYFDFLNGRNVGRVEVTIFNCPQLQTFVRQINIYYSQTATMYVPVVSCDSLVKLCIPIDTTLGPVNRILFSRSYRYAYIAEIAFYQSSSPCPYVTMIPGSPSNHSQTDSSATFPNTPFTTTTSAEAVNAANNAFSNTQSVLSVLSTITALQTVVILIVVVAVIFLFCVYITRRRAKPVGMKPTPAMLAATVELSAEEEMYETVEPGEQKLQPPKRKKNNPYTKQ